MRLPGVTDAKGIIAWFAANHVAANLLMVFIIVAGLLSSFSIRQQTMPEIELDRVRVQVPYLGAAPEEVEEGVVVKIEEAIQDVPGIAELSSVSREGLGTVTVEVDSSSDLNEVLNEIKTRVDAISTFPALTEKPVIYKQEVPQHVVMVSVHGDLDDYSRKRIAQQLRDELTTLAEVNQVEYLGEREYEISIEVSEQVLQQYGLTMSEVSQAVKDSSVDLPGGAIKTDGGDILLRTEGQVYTGQQYGDLVLRTFPDGTRLLLKDIATVEDGFVENERFGRLNGGPSANLRVMSLGQQNEIATAAAVRAFVDKRSARLPEGVEIDVWIDRSHYLKDRLQMMLKNMAQGALLVFVVLSLFLRMRVAFWVAVGIPVAFLGTLLLMPHGPFPVTINILSLFGFIMVLGIVVDDAIVIGESIYTTIRADGHTLDNVIRGTHRVAVPATYGVLTTIAAFAPLLFVGGRAAPFFQAMSVVVILCLIFSLIESKLILPAHLNTANIKPIDEDDLFHPTRRIPWLERVPRFFQKIQRHVQHGLHALIHDHYRPWLERAIDNRGMTITIFLVLLILSIGLIGSGATRLALFPDVPSDFVVISLQMENGSSPAARNAAVEKIESAALGMQDEFALANPDSLPMIRHVGVFTGGDLGATLLIEMPQDENKPVEGTELVVMLRERVGEMAGVKDLEFSGKDHMGGGAPLNFRLSGPDYAMLEGAAEELELTLATFNGVFDIKNSAGKGSQEIRLRIKPAAEALGLTMSSLGRQVRQAFYGEEAQRIQRGKDELKVMVRYPRADRRSIADLENMRIRTPSGEEVPFGSVAEVSFGEGFSSINRRDRMRTITVSADMDPLVTESREIFMTLQQEFMPVLAERFPSVNYGLVGASEEQGKLVRSMMIALVASLFLIYALIAIPLQSYGQPLVIMSVIPFGAIGAIAGHVILGKSMSMFSLFGLIALAGVVVNDSLIMVDFINKARAKGAELRQAVIDSGTQRFRAIALTSITTAVGLLPIMSEGSMQAQMVIPMAISVSFGILFATLITLFLVPSLYVMQIDGLAWFRDMRDLLLGRPATSGRASPDGPPQ